MMKDYDNSSTNKLSELEDEGDLYIALDNIKSNSGTDLKYKVNYIKENIANELKNNIQVLRYILKEMFRRSKWKRRVVILESLFKSNLLIIDTLLEENDRKQENEQKEIEMQNIQQNLRESNENLKNAINNLKEEYKGKIRSLNKIIANAKRENVI